MRADLREIARTLGGDVIAGNVVAPGPGHSECDRSLAVKLTAGGFLVHSYAGDDWKTCRDYVREKLGAPQIQLFRPSLAQRGERALERWEQASAARGTLVEKYLASRALGLDGVSADVLRFHPRCPWRDGDTFIRVPAMLAAFRSIAGDRLMAVQRTRLRDDGSKIARKNLGPVGGAAIKIDPDKNVHEGLHVGEGLETCLSARLLGFKPTWALGSAGAIAKFPVLSGIEALNILAESDDAGANARAVDECGQRWTAAGREVRIIHPKIRGDLNEAIQKLGGANGG
jgi:putative DNA primase/helicase